MKKLLLFAFLFVSATAMAQAPSRGRSVLKLRLSDRTPLSVNVDGRHFDEGGATITIGNLPAGPHRIEVYSESGYRMRPRRVYTGTIRVAPETMYIGVVDLYNRGLRLRDRPLDGYVQRGPGADRSDPRDDEYFDDRADRDRDRDDRYNGDEVYGDNRRGNEHNNTNADREGYGSFPRGRGDRNGNRSDVFTQRDMTDLKSRVSGRITDSDKEQLMKSVIEGRTVYTDQVREMLGWLSFESTRLDFAKWAFSRVEDEQNYWKLDDVFTFSSSKKEFNDAIRRSR